ncbi:MAG: calcium/sodium antiporter [Alphaproteobacteria bacterium]
MLFDSVLVIIGLVLLFFGGEWLVRGSVVIAERLGLSHVLIGVVVVGFGTSAPELFVAVNAVLENRPDIAVGNVVGSNIANILLVLGCAAMIYPVFCKDAVIKRDAIIVVLASILLIGLAWFGVISRIAGGVMVSALILYLFYCYKAEKKQAVTGDSPSDIAQDLTDFSDAKTPLVKGMIFAAGGMFLLVFGADWLVTGASNIARVFNVSEAVIGLSLVAIGTSLPELATAIAASLKKHSDVLIGNILGSNLFNILSILGISALVKPVAISSNFIQFDMPLGLATAVIALIIIIFVKAFTRFIGALFLIAYLFYLGYLFV